MKIYKFFFAVFFVFSILAIGSEAAEPKAEPERTNIYLRVVAVNPSKKEPKTVEVKNYLPPEVRPKSVVNTGGLELRYDKKRSLYYLYKKDVKLEASEIKIFKVGLEDVWFIPQKELDALKVQSQNILDRIKGKRKAKRIGLRLEEINKKLKTIAGSQEAAKAGSFREQIVNYRNNQQALKRIKEELKQLKESAREKKK